MTDILWNEYPAPKLFDDQDVEQNRDMRYMSTEQSESVGVRQRDN